MLNKKILITFILTIVILYLTSIDLAHALTDVLIPNVTHVAYEATSGDLYEDPAFADVEFTSDQYDKVSVSDDNRESTTLSVDAWNIGSVAQKFRFDLTKYLTGYKIINVTYYYEGYGTSDCSHVLKSPYIMYYSSYEWTNDQALPTSETTKTKTYTSGFPDIIISNTFEFGVVMSYLTNIDCTMEIHTDFVKLEINYVPYQPEIITVCSSGCNATTVQGGVDLAWDWGEDTVLITESGSFGSATIDKPLNLTSNSTTKPSTGRIVISSENVSVSNLIINNGISSQRNNTIISNNEITRSLWSYGYGVQLYNDNHIITNNNITTTGYGYGYGIYVAGSNNNTVTNNNITTTGLLSHGIRLSYSTNNIISHNNIITPQAYGLHIALDQSETSDFDNTIDTTNNVDGKPLYYYFNKTSITLENLDDIGQLYVAHSSNIIIRNLTIDKYGIFFVKSNYSTITDSNVTTSSYAVDGVYFYKSQFNNLSNSDISTSGELANGVYTFGGDNNTVSNTNIFTSADQAPGVYLDFYSDHNNITETNVSTSGTNSWGIFLDSYSDHNNITETNVSTSGTNSYGLYIKRSSYNSITSSRINASYSGVADIYLITLSTDNIFLDTIYTDESVDSGSKLKKLWYLDVYVNDTHGNPISGVNVSAWNTNNDLTFSELTASNGYITRKELIRYTQSGSSKTYYTNYTVNATKTGYSIDSEQIDLRRSMLTYLTISKAHETYGTLISTTKSKAWYITQVIPTWSSYEPTGTSITIYVSANGGTDWEEVTNGTKHTFSNSGKDFKYKAIFQTSDVYATPILYNVNFYYSTIPNETVTIRTETNRNVYVGFFDVNLTGSETTYKDKFQKSYTLP